MRRIGLGFGIGFNFRPPPTSGGTPTPTVITPPSIAGTLTNGSTITATPGTWSSGTATGQWHRDGSPISGQTALTYTYVEATDAGSYLTYVEANGGANAISNALIAGQNTIAYATSFAGADGTLINGFESWVLGGSENTNTYRITGNDMSMHQAGAGDDHGVARDIGTGNLYFETTVYLDPASDSARKDRRIGIRYINSSNYVILRVHANGLRLVRRIAGTGLELLAVTNGAYATTNGQRIGLRADGNYIRIFLNGNEIAESIAANGGLGFDISGTTGTKVFLNSANSGATPAYPFKVFTDAIVQSLPASEIFIASSIVEQIVGGNIVAKLTGTLTGSIATMQALVLSSTGKVLLDWQDVAGISGSTFNVTTSALPIEAQGQNVIIWLRNKADHKVASSKVQALGYYAAVAPTVLGLNEQFYVYWAGGDQIRDYGKRASWLQGDYNFIPPANIDPVTLLPVSYPSGQTSLIARNAVRERYGVYNVTYPPSMNFVELAAGSTNVTVTTPFTGGSGQITVTATGSVMLRFNGTLPAGGADITMRLAGDTSPKTYTDQMLDDFTDAGFRIARFMTPAGINSSAPWPLTSVNRLVPFEGSGRACTVEHMVEFCNDANCHLWFNVHHQADDSWIDYHAAYIAANLNSHLKCYVELSNEMWNSFPSNTYSFVYGARAGYYNTNGDAGAQTIINVDSGGPDATGTLDPSTGYPNTSYPPGTLIMGNRFGSGWMIWQALTTTPTGAAGVVPTSGSNTNWTVISNYDGVRRGGRRWQGVRSVQAFDIFDSKFENPRARVIRVIGIQATDSVSAVMERIGFSGVYAKTDRVASAPYWGGGVGGVNLSRYDSGHVTGFGATEKALYSTDIPAWKDALFSAANSAIDAAITSQVTLKNALETTLRQAPYNLAPNTIQLCSYECNHHIVLVNYPNTALAQAAFQSFRQDARLGTAMTYYLNLIRDRIGGEHVLFDSVATDMPSLQGWGLMNYQGDRANPLYPAVAAWITANP